MDKLSKKEQWNYLRKWRKDNDEQAFTILYNSLVGLAAHAGIQLCKEMKWQDYDCAIHASTNKLYDCLRKMKIKPNKRMSTYIYHSCKIAALEAWQDSGPIRLPKNSFNNGYRKDAIRAKNWHFPVSTESVTDTSVDERDLIDKQEEIDLKMHRVKYEISKLHPRQQTVLNLRYFSDKSHKEIAEIMETSAYNTKQILYIALRHLKRKFKEETYDEA